MGPDKEHVKPTVKREKPSENDSSPEIVESTSKIQKLGRGSAVLWLYTELSRYSKSQIKLSGETVGRLNRAVIYNANLDNESPFSKSTNPIRKQIPMKRNRKERTARLFSNFSQKTEHDT